jgi:hypothetical protein
MEIETLETPAEVDPNPVDGKAPYADLDNMSKRIEEIYISVEKTRKYFLWTLIITIVTIVLPLIALIIIIPMVLRTYSSALGGM